MELTFLASLVGLSNTLQTVLTTTLEPWMATTHGDGMGMIAAITPATKTSNPILRAKVTPSDMSRMGRVPILFHREESHATTAVTYQKLVTMTAQNPTADWSSYGRHLRCLPHQGLHGLERCSLYSMAITQGNHPLSFFQ